MGTPEHREVLLKCLNELSVTSLPVSQQLGLLRAYALVLERLGILTNKQRETLLAKFDPLLPAANGDVSAEVLRLLVYLRAPSAASKGMKLIADRGPGIAPSWSGVEQLNARYGSTLKQITKNPPPTAALDIAMMLRNLPNGWTLELRREYFKFLNTAAKASGGASYPGYLTKMREEALANCSNDERKALVDLTGEDFNPVPDFAIEPPTGPGKEWTLTEALATVAESSPKNLSFKRGRSLFHAVSCGACHRFSGLGGGVGPDLTSVPNKFDTRYLLEAILEPSKNISDQYQSSTVTLRNGKSLTGLVVEHRCQYHPCLFVRLQSRTDACAAIRDRGTWPLAHFANAQSVVESDERRRTS